jgi:hypothetical protein
MFDFGFESSIEKHFLKSIECGFEYEKQKLNILKNE